MRDNGILYFTRAGLTAIAFQRLEPNETRIKFGLRHVVVWILSTGKMSVVRVRLEA